MSIDPVFSMGDSGPISASLSPCGVGFLECIWLMGGKRLQGLEEPRLGFSAELGQASGLRGGRGGGEAEVT